MSDAALYWLAAARRLGSELAARSVRLSDGALAWQDPMTASPSRLAPHFYGGTAGIAFFLGALAHRLGPAEGETFAILARDAIAPLRDQLRRLAADPERASRAALKIGAGIGLGAYIYAFRHLADWLAEPELLAEAHRLATLISPGRIAADSDLDVAFGSAGAILALLAIEPSFPAGQGFPSPRERAKLCAERLLATRSRQGAEPPAWAASGSRPLCGFLHGAAGIAYALERLAAVDPDPRYRAAIEDADAFERFHFDGQAGNWPDLRQPGLQPMIAWCSGASGIALGRLERARQGDPAAAAVLAVALATIRDGPEQDRDTPCCGNLGRAEVLLEASFAGGSEQLRHDAEEIARTCVEKGAAGGGYRYFSGEPTRFSPGLFVGAAGIGYTLLRFASPGELPCVLAFR